MYFAKNRNGIRTVIPRKMSKKIPGHRYSYNIEKIKNRSDKSLLVLNDTNDCPDIFQDDVAFFDQVTELHISCDNANSKKDCVDIVKFHNLEYLSISALTLEMSTWTELFQNCSRLKELHLCSGSGCWFYFTKEVFSEIFKLPKLETLEIRKLSLPFWPIGPSNITYLELSAIRENYSKKSYTEDYQRYFHTHTNLKEVNIRINALDFTPFLISTLNLDQCFNLEVITIRTQEDNLHKSIHKILQLPRLKKISFIECQMEYFVRDNSLIFGNVEEIYIGDLKMDPNVNKRCFKYVEDKNGHYISYYHTEMKKCYGYPSKDNVKAMLSQCPKLSICMLDNERLL